MTLVETRTAELIFEPTLMGKHIETCQWKTHIAKFDILRTVFLENFRSHKHKTWYTCTLGLGVPVSKIQTASRAIGAELLAPELE